ncbi:hypothetical protein HDU97_008612 [Phlyctochytrium planicorne]|nr:hypothetical protein HDU97_008612 [Phlyctochytrium planicorne]
MSPVVFLQHTVEDPATIDHVLWQKITSAAGRELSRLILIVSIPSLDPHDEPTQSKWQTLQNWLTHAYSLTSQSSKRPFLNVDIIVLEMCGYDPWVNDDILDLSADQDLVLIGEDTGLLQEVNSRRSSKSLSALSFIDIGAIAKQDDIHINKEESKETRRAAFEVVAVGGTFDHLHGGHKILLTSCVWLTLRKLICGVYDFSGNEARLLKKKAGDLMEPIDFRLQRVTQFLRMMKSGINYHIVPITDDYGPTKDEPDIQALVGSLETAKGCDAVNELRASKGLSHLSIFLVGLVSPSGDSDDVANKLSSSAIREYIKQHL